MSGKLAQGCVIVFVACLPLQVESRDPHYHYLPDEQAVVYGGMWWDWEIHGKETADAKRLFVRKLGSNAPALFWQSAGRISKVKLNRAGGLIGFLERVPPNSNALIILNLSGQVVGQYPGKIYDFDFDETGRRVAYATGQDADHEGAELWESLGVYVAELPAGSPKLVRDTGDAVAWAEFDGRLYILDRAPVETVHRYDPTSSSVIRTSFYGLDFSPTGEYYCRAGIDTRFELFRRAANSPVGLEDRPDEVASDAVSWSPDGSRLMVTEPGSQFGPHGRVTYVYDIPSGQLFRVFDHVLDWGATKDDLVILDKKTGAPLIKKLSSYPQF